MKQDQIVIYQTEDGKTQIDVRLENETVWLTQAQMVELFQTTKQNVSLHLGNLYKEGELEKEGTVKEFLKVQQEGKRKGMSRDCPLTSQIEDSVNDPTYSGVFNFMDGASQDNEYTYDKNGNLTKDLNKNISSIQYNLLNLPTSITYSTPNIVKSATYVYDATGKKLRVTYTNPNSTTDYCGNMIYENNVLKQILVDGGYVTFSGSTPQYHFYLKDHLGNNRVVVNASGTKEQVNHYYLFGGLFGESTSGDAQRFKYNGKELDRMHGLDWYDYGARHMDGMRFTTIDPLAEKYSNISPYAYCANNPLKYIDTDGRETGLPEEILFGLLHPIAAYNIGNVSHNSTNISTNATRFSTALGLNENSQHEGSQVNAFRHTLWQATITNKYGSEVAKAVGDSHENDPNVDLNQRSFKGENALNQADQSIDLLNNKIGRSLGSSSKTQSMKDLANSVLDCFYKNGLYVATMNADGSVSIKKEKLSAKSYGDAKKSLNQLNKNGFTQKQQKQIDKEYEHDIQSLQIIWGTTK